MSPTSRRIFFYWLLLLLPTLAVGVAAIQLLRREQERLAEQSAYAIASRQAAVAARARLIVENLELLVGDVQQGLLDALAEQPENQLEDFVRDWEANNPLVRTVFLARENGELLWPNQRATGDNARGFVRRFDSIFREQPPWRESSGAPAAAEAERTVKDEAGARGEVTSNVAQVQSARRDVKELLKSRSYASVPSPAPALADDRVGSASVSGRQAEEADAERRGAAIIPEPKRAAPATRRGWLAQPLDGRLHVLGWVQADGAADFRGVELDLSELVRRLGDALPAETSADEGYVLRDEQGRVLHQAGVIPRGGEPTARVPLAGSLLPGWDVAAYLPLRYYSSGDGGAFFWVGSVLVGIFVAAILAGGSLLLWQARRSEQEAAQKTSFVANVSHEFKTPLTTIRLYAELLEQGRVRDAAQGGDYLRTIGRETQRLARLVNNALDFSRLEQGKKKFARQPVDLVSELGRLLDTQAPRLAEMNLRLVRVLPEESLVVTTDRDAVEQIVLNLIDNAGKYAASGGEVTVTLAARGGCSGGAGQSGGAEVRVGDRGPGVPAAQRERIFEKFHRVDDALTAEKSGAGLGLSIARQLARGLGGGLRYADRVGGGAEFILELP